MRAPAITGGGAAMLRIEPTIWIHTSRTGASSFSAISGGSVPAARSLDGPQRAHFRFFRRQRIGIAGETDYDSRPL